MSASKNILAVACLVGVEASYSSSAALTGSVNTIEYAERPVFATSYTQPGDRSYNNGTAGTKSRIPPTARVFATSIKMEAKGTGATQTGSVTPPAGIHPLMLASGYSASFANLSWSYQQQVPDPPFSSVQFEVYERGYKYQANAGYCDLKFAIDKANQGFLTFDVKGLIGLPSVVARAGTNYAYKNVLPPQGVNVGFTVGGYAGLKVQKIDFALGRTIEARDNINSLNGFAGYSPGRRKPVLTVTVEQEDIGTFNPYTTLQNATVTAVSFTLGSVTNNSIGFSAPNATLSDVKDAVMGDNVATWELVFDLPDTPTLNEGHTWTWF